MKPLTSDPLPSRGRRTEPLCNGVMGTTFEMQSQIASPFKRERGRVMVLL
jgi:hypothetical protein